MPTNMLMMQSAMTRLLTTRQKIQSQAKVKITVIIDSEYDDLFLAGALRDIAANPAIQLTVIYNAGSKDFALTMHNKSELLEGLQIKEARIIIGAIADKDTLLKNRHQLSQEEKEAIQEADILINTCQAVNLVEYCQHHMDQKPRAQVYLRTGGINDEWTAKYLMAHYLPQQVAEFAAAAAASAAAANPDDKKAAGKAAEKVKYTWGAEANYTIAQNLAPTPVLVQKFLLEALFGKQLSPSKRLEVSRSFGSITPDFYPILSALLLDGATNAFGTKSGKLFLFSAKKSNENLVNKWGRLIGKVLKSEIRGEQTLEEVFLASLDPEIVSLETLQAMRENMITFLQTGLKIEPLVKIDHISTQLKAALSTCAKTIPHPEKNEMCDPKSTGNRYIATVQYVYQMLWADQSIALLLNFILGDNHSNILANCMSEHSFNGVSGVYAQRRTPDNPGDPTTFLEAVDAKDLTAGEKETGIINGELFQTHAQIDMVKACLPFVQDHSPAKAIALGYLQAWDHFKLSGTGLDSPEYALFQQQAAELSEQAKQRVEPTMRLLDLELEAVAIATAVVTAAAATAAARIAATDDNTLPPLEAGTPSVLWQASADKKRKLEETYESKQPEDDVKATRVRVGYGT